MALPYQYRDEVDAPLREYLLRLTREGASRGLLIRGPSQSGKKRALVEALHSFGDQFAAVGCTLTGSSGEGFSIEKLLADGRDAGSDPDALRWIDAGDHSMSIINASAIFTSPHPLVSLAAAALTITMKALKLQNSLDQAFAKLRHHAPLGELAVSQLFDDARLERPLVVMIDEWDQTLEEETRASAYDLLGHWRRTGRAARPALVCLVIDEDRWEDAHPDLREAVEREAVDNGFDTVAVPSPRDDQLLNAARERYAATDIRRDLSRFLVEYAQGRWDLLQQAMVTLDSVDALKTSPEGVLHLEAAHPRQFLAVDRLLSRQIPRDAQLQQVMIHAAMQGGVFTEEVLAETLGSTPEQVYASLQAVQDLSRASDLPPPVTFAESVTLSDATGTPRTLSRWRFSHPLLPAHLRDTLPPDERTALARLALAGVQRAYAPALRHVRRSLVRLYEEIGDQKRANWARSIYRSHNLALAPDRVLHHYHDGRVGASARVVRALIGAGRTAKWRGDGVEMERCYEQALELAAQVLHDVELQVTSLWLWAEDLLPTALKTAQDRVAWQRADDLLSRAESVAGGPAANLDVRMVRLAWEEVGGGLTDGFEWLSRTEALAQAFAGSQRGHSAAKLWLNLANRVFPYDRPRAAHYLDLAGSAATEDGYLQIEWHWHMALLKFAEDQPGATVEALEDAISLSLMQRPLNLPQLAHLTMDAVKIACFYEMNELMDRLAPVVLWLLQSYRPRMLGDIDVSLLILVLWRAEHLRSQSHPDLLELLRVPQLHDLATRTERGFVLAMYGAVVAPELGDPRLGARFLAELGERLSWVEDRLREAGASAGMAAEPNASGVAAGPAGNESPSRPPLPKPAPLPARPGPVLGALNAPKWRYVMELREALVQGHRTTVAFEVLKRSRRDQLHHPGNAHLRFVCADRGVDFSINEEGTWLHAAAP